MVEKASRHVVDIESGALGYDADRPIVIIWLWLTRIQERLDLVWLKREHGSDKLCILEYTSASKD